jgi:outer membrane protein assembly factor BamB
MSRQAALWVAFFGLSPAFTPAADWPGWRGPRGDGRADGGGYPVTWSPAENVRWKTTIPGTGHSSPIVSNGRVFVTACREAEQTRVLYCLDRASGNILWERTVLAAPLEKKHKLNSFASSTPAADGERVYVTFFDDPRLRIYCYDFAGNKLWDESPGEFHSQHGFCSPPLLYKNLVIVNGDQDALAYIVAHDKRTGREVWRADRANRTRSYCPPVVYDLAGRKQLVLTGSKCVASYDPDTGQLLWVIDGPTEQFVSSMVVSGDVLFLTAGFPEHWVMAIDPSGRGNVTKSHVLWAKKKEGGYVPSPVADDGYFFLVTDEGLGSCWDAKTGTKCWAERLGKHHSASAVAAEGRVYFTDDDGVTFVVRAGSEFELLARNSIGERSFASPAFSDGDVFLRGEKSLFCIGRGRSK